MFAKTAFSEKKIHLFFLYFSRFYFFIFFFSCFFFCGLYVVSNMHVRMLYLML